MAKFANTLFYGDNLPILRKHFPDQSVDLIYLDPPFNSNRDYNVLFREASGEEAPAQIKAFTDTFRWSADKYREFVESQPPSGVLKLIDGFVETLGRNDVTAYLVEMAPRLVELHRVLKPTGSLYLHCDPTASSYLRLLLDRIFSPKCFKNEIVWHYKRWPTVANRFQRMHDILLFYGKQDRVNFNLLVGERTESTLRRWKKQKIRAHFDEEGRRIPSEGLPEESEGVPLDDVWDIPIIAPSARERLGYPTQKPLALLERIVSASSNPGDIVLDPFCGCGTAIVAAQKLSRKWIGIDITHLAIALIKYRLADSFDIFARKNYKVVGEPVTISEARALANDDRDEFQKWAVGLVDRARLAQEKKGADKGIDGVFYFIDDPKRPANKVVLQVRSGHVTVSQIRDLCGVFQREKAAFGLFITLENPTSSMRKEAETVRFYDSSDGRKYPRLQIRTIGELLKGENFDLPPYVRKSGVKRAGRVGKPQNENETLKL